MYKDIGLAVAQSLPHVNPTWQGCDSRLPGAIVGHPHWVLYKLQTRDAFSSGTVTQHPRSDRVAFSFPNVSPKKLLLIDCFFHSEFKSTSFVSCEPQIS